MGGRGRKVIITYFSTKDTANRFESDGINPPKQAHPLDKLSKRGPVFSCYPAAKWGRCAPSLLFCLLLSLGAGWAQSQLTTADQLAADTLRLHIRADTDSVRDQSAKLAVRDAVLALTDEACPADSRADARRGRRKTSSASS